MLACAKLLSLPYHLRLSNDGFMPFNLLITMEQKTVHGS